ncbi:Galacturonosyltransferase 8 [Nymphaea thermarum]|nr:Galacturonosyltransferase 8 [Nymphaea thermarum]
MNEVKVTLLLFTSTLPFIAKSSLRTPSKNFSELLSKPAYQPIVRSVSRLKEAPCWAVHYQNEPDEDPEAQRTPSSASTNSLPELRSRATLQHDCRQVHPQDPALPGVGVDGRTDRPPEKVHDCPPAAEFENPNLYHYAVISDNVIAASVVVNSAVKNANDPQRDVFHVVTDKMNLAAMHV